MIRSERENSDPPRLGRPPTANARWARAEPDNNLTWGRRLTGDAFIRAVRAHYGFSPKTTVLEIGPGYGRLLRSLLDQQVPFGRYYGVDLSLRNRDWLAQQFADSRVTFLHANAESVVLPERWDVAISSLTMKHMYPNFEKVLAHLAVQANPSAKFVFDLIEATPLQLMVDLIETEPVRRVFEQIEVDPRKLPPRLARSWGSRGAAEDGRGAPHASGLRAFARPLIDLVGQGSYGRFESDGETFIRTYLRSGADRVVQKAGFRVAAFGKVRHDNIRVRMLVVSELVPAAG